MEVFVSEGQNNIRITDIINFQMFYLTESLLNFGSAVKR